MNPEETIEYIKKSVPDFGRKGGGNLFNYILYNCARYKHSDKMKNQKDPLLAEFGVFTGMSMSWISKCCDNQQVHGFDTFEGLPEDGVGSDGGVVFTKGHFAIDFDPVSCEQFIYHKGLFQDTLEPFLKSNPNPLGLVHIDCDLYSSTSYVLEQIRDRLVSGTVIMLDDFCLYRNYQDFVWKAWFEFVDKNSELEWEYISSCGMNDGGWATVAIQIK